MLIKSQLEVHLHTVRSVHFHPSNLPDPPFRFFEGLVPRLAMKLEVNLGSVLESELRQKWRYGKISLE